MKFIGRIVAILLLFIGQTVFSQIETFPSASVDESGCVQLPTDVPLGEFYTIDMTSFEYVDSESLDKELGSKSSNLLTYRSDYDHNLVILQVHVDRTDEPHTLDWWNAYLDSICSGD